MNEKKRRILRILLCAIPVHLVLWLIIRFLILGAGYHDLEPDVRSSIQFLYLLISAALWWSMIKMTSVLHESVSRKKLDQVGSALWIAWSATGAVLAVVLYEMCRDVIPGMGVYGPLYFIVMDLDYLACSVACSWIYPAAKEEEDALPE